MSHVPRVLNLEHQEVICRHRASSRQKLHNSSAPFCVWFEDDRPPPGGEEGKWKPFHSLFEDFDPAISAEEAPPEEALQLGAKLASALHSVKVFGHGPAILEKH
jgi:hypothetical protein